MLTEAHFWFLPTLALLALTFLVGGFVKGVVGLGLPTIALSILTAGIGLKHAVALILVPTIVTNIWQAIAGPALAKILRRLWPFLGLVAWGLGSEPDCWRRVTCSCSKPCLAC